MVRLSDDAQAFIRQSVNSGRFSSAEAVLEAAIVRLREEEWEGPDAAEMKRLVEDARGSVEREGTIDGEAFMDQFIEDLKKRTGL